MHVCVLIQARCGSTRLPGKVLMDLAGKPVLERVIERVRRATGVDEVVVVTTLEKRDLPLVRLCAERGIRVFCGSENDVLDRFYQAAKLLQCEHLVRITADCPVMDSALLSEVLARHLASGADYTANVIEESYPDGEDIEAFTFQALEKAWKEASLPSEREHVTPYIRKNASSFKHESVVCAQNHARERWTLDTQKDYEFLTRLYELLAPENEFFGMADILAALRKHPELREINTGIARNEGYEKSLREDGKRG